MPGFRRWQTFRAMDTTNALLVVLDWSSAELLRTALSNSLFCGLHAGAGALGCVVDEVTVLDSAFDRRSGRGKAVASLLRIGHTGRPIREIAARDNDFSLQAMAAPGSTRLSGARSANGLINLCRIEFDTEDGIWHFLESSLCKRWSALAHRGLEEETWALNLPRLDYRVPDPARTSGPRRAVPDVALNVRLHVSDDGGTAALRIHGRVDARGSARCETICETLIANGCRRLEVDVSELARISSDALEMLTRTARRLKAAGGAFVLIDNVERVKRVTRKRHLESSVY